MQAAATSMAGASRGRGLSTATEATCQWDPCWHPQVGRAGRLLSEALARPAASGFPPPQVPAHCARPGHYRGPRLRAVMVLQLAHFWFNLCPVSRPTPQLTSGCTQWRK